MPDLASFNAFVTSTGAKIRSGPNDIHNDAVKNTYFIRRMLKGRDPAQTTQAGSTIKDVIQLNDVGTAEFYHPNEDMDHQNVDSAVSIEIRWRFIADHFAYTEQEATLNSGSPQTYYKNLIKGKRQACRTSTYNKMEDAIWDPASNANMEAASGKQPYSIPALVTTDGLAPTGFTTIMTVNPTTESGWRNQIETYDPSAVESETDGLMNAFDRMFHEVRFIGPMAGPQEYFSSDLLQKMVIATNLDGIAMLQRLTRGANDRLTPATNLGYVAGQVTYAGLPITYISTLNTALVNGGAIITANQPWFYFLNLAFLFPIFHTTKYFAEKAPITPDRQPFSSVVWIQTWYNMFMISRKRQGLISPA